MTPEWSDVGARVLASSPQDSSILVLLALFGASFGFFVPAGELSSSSFRPASFRLAPVAGFFVAFLLPSAMIQSVGSDSGLLCCGSGCTLGWCFIAGFLGLLGRHIGEVTENGWKDVSKRKDKMFF